MTLLKLKGKILTHFSARHASRHLGAIFEKQQKKQFLSIFLNGLQKIAQNKSSFVERVSLFDRTFPKKVTWELCENFWQCWLMAAWRQDFTRYLERSRPCCRCTTRTNAPSTSTEIPCWPGQSRPELGRKKNQRVLPECLKIANCLDWLENHANKSLFLESKFPDFSEFAAKCSF